MCQYENGIGPKYIYQSELELVMAYGLLEKWVNEVNGGFHKWIRW